MHAVCTLVEASSLLTAAPPTAPTSCRTVLETTRTLFVWLVDLVRLLAFPACLHWCLPNVTLGAGCNSARAAQPAHAPADDEPACSPLHTHPTQPADSLLHSSGHGQAGRELERLQLDSGSGVSPAFYGCCTACLTTPCCCCALVCCRCACQHKRACLPFTTHTHTRTALWCWWRARWCTARVMRRRLQRRLQGATLTRMWRSVRARLLSVSHLRMHRAAACIEMLGMGASEASPKLTRWRP